MHLWPKSGEQWARHSTFMCVYDERISSKICSFDLCMIRAHSDPFRSFEKIYLPPTTDGGEKSKDCTSNIVMLVHNVYWMCALQNIHACAIRTRNEHTTNWICVTLFRSKLCTWCMLIHMHRNSIIPHNTGYTVWYADERTERGSSNEMNLLKLLLKFKYIIGTHNRPTQRRERASTPTRRQSTSESEEEEGGERKSRKEN